MSKCIKCLVEHTTGFWDNGFICGSCYGALVPTLTLRDQFAISIAPAVFSYAIEFTGFKDQTWENTVLAVAKVCYKFADACEKEREKK